MKTRHLNEGIAYALLSYMMWGFTPVYWKLLQHISSAEILAQRICWSFVFMLAVLCVSGKTSAFVTFLNDLPRRPRSFGALFLAAVLISANWGIFMWAVLNGKIIEASLGQYITPLVSMLVGVVALKERPSRSETLAFFLAGSGVLLLTLHYGAIPWLALSLAFSFAFYGLVKKTLQTDSSISLALETLTLAPLALLYLYHLSLQAPLQFNDSFVNAALLAGSGVVTALPLLLFTKSAKTVSLSRLVILQYISPTLSLLTGVFLYQETVSTVHWLAFFFIWSALALYACSSLLQQRTRAA
ncbi:EamA family transporter RarD [Azotosporobacter soli]|uniref:EamA family transporter RarD n=1 Tax=Azotosporobacter soli TaxID=3055040 RepID=UPI0031FE7B94